MFGWHWPSVFAEVMFALVAIMALDWWKGWRGWKYYCLAFFALFVMQILSPVLFAIGYTLLAKK